MTEMDIAREPAEADVGVLGQSIVGFALAMAALGQERAASR